MANRTILLCLVLVFLANQLECRRSGSSGYGRGSSSSGRHSYGGSSRHSYPSSSSGHSGFGNSKPSYPSSSSGLSGFGYNKPSYPSSSGLSGSGGSSYKPSYPASHGLSGFGFNKPSYPTAPGLSGSGGGNSYKPSYPASHGLSGSGGGISNKPSYPASPGLSGSGSNKPIYSSSGNVYSSGNHYNSNNNNYNQHGSNHPSHPSYGQGIHHTSYNPGYGGGSFGHPYYTQPSYFTAPQHIYINEYRNSGSRYGDILTGLALYNLGRSRSHYHDHYYNDDYYRRRYTSDSQYNPSYKPKDEATCTLKVKENGKEETLKIPCEIVSTFTEGSSKITPSSVTNKTVCVTNITTTTSLENPSANITKPIFDITNTNVTETVLNSTISNDNNVKNDNLTVVNSNVTAVNMTDNTSNETNVAVAPLTLPVNTTSTNISTTPKSNISNLTVSPYLTTTSALFNISNTNKPTANVLQTNTTVCHVEVTDPVAIKGPPVNGSNMECSVEIISNNAHLMHHVDCNTLVQYSKKPEPSKESSILPSKEKLKSMLAKPPWWLAMFVAA